MVSIRGFGRYWYADEFLHLILQAVLNGLLVHGCGCIGAVVVWNGRRRWKRSGVGYVILFIVAV